MLGATDGVSIAAVCESMVRAKVRRVCILLIAVLCFGLCICLRVSYVCFVLVFCLRILFVRLLLVSVDAYADFNHFVFEILSIALSGRSG